MDKTRRRTLPPHLIPGNPGNSGGKKGRSGRKPNYFLEQCQKLTQDPVAWDVYHARNRSGDLDVMKFGANYTHGKPTEHTDVSGDLTIRVEFDGDA